MNECWYSFKAGLWKKTICVNDFIEKNYTSYEGDEAFLAPPSEKTKKVWSNAKTLIEKEIKEGIIDIDTHNISGITAFKPGYIDQDNEVIVGLQTDAPLKRIVNPYGGVRMVNSSLASYGKKLDKELEVYLNKFIKTHNDGVFDAYTKEILAARKSGLLTGLPDAYGRGRIIGDYRRIALYGIDLLVADKQKDLINLRPTSEENIRLREEVSRQIRALNSIKEMALSYGFDLSHPAKDAKEAFQWLYFAYLAVIKQNNGAATSLGRVSTFLDIYLERDLKKGILTEAEAQELVDQFVIKLRLVRHLRTPEYNELFAGDPTWVTESIGGISDKGKPLVTKNSYRFLHSLTNLGAAPEPNLTVLWSKKLPKNFKTYCAKVSIATDAIQYENDDVIRPLYGADYGISCCVSAMKIGEQMQFFGARCNVAKALLYSINGGIDEVSGVKVLDGISKVEDKILDYNKVLKNYHLVLDKTAKLYTEAMNIIHFMHDKYAYESSQMALHNTMVERLMAFGIAGLSVAVDSLSAIKYAKVTPIRNEQGIAIDFKIQGDYPMYGNDDDRVDNMAIELIKYFLKALKKHALYRGAKHTLSILTITSNVVYGKMTGNTPDGRKLGEPLAPGANPMHGRDQKGALASLNSVAKIKFVNLCQDGISNTFCITGHALGKDLEEQSNTLVNILDGYFAKGAFHLNVNVLTKEVLIDAMKNPSKYPLLTIRVSGYAVHFNRLSKEQQEEVIKRTFHEVI